MVSNPPEQGPPTGPPYPPPSGPGIPPSGTGYPPPGAGYGYPPAGGYAPPGGFGPPGGYSPWGGGAIEHPQGTTVLVVGIMSLVLTGTCVIGVLLGPVAWIMGNRVLGEIDADPSRYTNRGAVQAGRICGIIATVLLVVGIVALVVLVGASASSSS